jgi:tRNA dimethylallyltransferase
MKGIGYREFFQWREEGCLSLDELKERIKKNTRNYAKRQQTFFKTLPGIQWFHPGETDRIGQAVREFLNCNG